MAAQGSSSSDFTSFVQARWPVLVRSLAAEGVAPAAAESAVVRVLARLRARWSRTTRSEDADQRVWADVRDELGLEPDVGGVAPGLADPRLLHRASDVVVSPDPLGLIEREVRRRRRTALRGVAGAVAACVVVGGYLAWATTRTPGPDVDEEANPAPVPWFADGRLHLEEVSVELSDLTEFVVTGDDTVAYADSGGRWFTVDGDGDVEPTDPPPDEVSSGLVESPDDRFLVHVADGGAIVYETMRGETIDLGLDDVRVVDATFAEDGSLTFLVSNLLERPDDSAVRLSETGTNGLRTCTVEPVECRDVVRVSGIGRLRIR